MISTKLKRRRTETDVEMWQYTLNVVATATGGGLHLDRSHLGLEEQRELASLCDEGQNGRLPPRWQEARPLGDARREARGPRPGLGSALVARSAAARLPQPGARRDA